jgi:hypothetical protein
VEKRTDAVGVTVVADLEPAVGQQPGDRAFGLPAVPPQSVAALDPAPGDPAADPAPAQVGAAAGMVIGLVSVDLGRSSPRAARSPVRTPDRWDGVQQWLEQP